MQKHEVYVCVCKCVLILMQKHFWYKKMWSSKAYSYDMVHHRYVVYVGIYMM